MKIVFVDIERHSGDVMVVRGERVVVENLLKIGFRRVRRLWWRVRGEK